MRDHNSLLAPDFKCIVVSGDNPPTIECTRHGDLHLLSCEVYFVYCKSITLMIKLFIFGIGGWGEVSNADTYLGKGLPITPQSWAVLRAGLVPSIHEFIDIVECYVRQIVAALRIDGGLIVEYFGPKFWSQYSNTTHNITPTGREKFLELILGEGSHKRADWGLQSHSDLIQVLLHFETIALIAICRFTPRVQLWWSVLW